jgi:two-component system sensor histidine kinase/response regulator
LTAALESQKREREKGNSPLLGQILIDMGFIDRATLDRAVTNQIIKLQKALQQANQTLEKRVQQRTAELEKAYQKLAELNKLKNNFVSNISHELRTPMTHVKGYVDLLLGNDFGELNPDQRDAIEVLKRASERLSRLIDDLILFSTAETSSVQISRQKVDIFSLAKDVVDHNLALAGNKKIQLWLDCKIQPFFTNADPEKIRWVLNQLVDNAIKFTPPEGEVFLRITQVPDGALISVIDTGIGIDPARFEEIFEPFHQLDGSSTRRQGGTGLGLTLVKKIVEAHGSKIVVTSIPGKGSKFDFNLNA